MNRALASSAKPNAHDRIFDTQGDDYEHWVPGNEWKHGE